MNIYRSIPIYAIAVQGSHNFTNSNIRILGQGRNYHSPTTLSLVRMIEMISDKVNDNVMM